MADKRIAITQSNYIPWKGYFDLINSVDEFILLDDVQYTRRDWRNRNRIKTTSEPRWLSIPVQVKGRYAQRIDETMVVSSDWSAQHWKAIVQAYRRAPAFEWCAGALEAEYLGAATEPRLSVINRAFIEVICNLLQITTPIRWSTEFDAQGTKTDRLLSICHATGATHYISGPAARAYIEPERFSQADIQLEYADYSGYPEYPQLHPPFVHEVSVIDLLCNTGRDAMGFLKSASR